MPTSSSRYSARISPEPRLRLALLVVSGTLGLAGVWVVSGLPWPVGPRLVAAGLWISAMLAGLGRQLRGFGRASRYRIHAGGEVDVITPGGRAVAARLAAGTTVYTGIAWLRFRTADGEAWGELVAAPRCEAKRLKNKDWRRLQVICRHLPAC